MNVHKVTKMPSRLSGVFLTALVYAFAAMLTLSLITSFVLTGTNVQEQALPVIVYVIHGLSVLIGGGAAGRMKGVKGWYYGGMLGVLYWLVIIGIAFLGFDSQVSLNALLTLIVCFLAGAIGGIVGVNMRRN